MTLLQNPDEFYYCTDIIVDCIFKLVEYNQTKPNQLHLIFNFTASCAAGRVCLMLFAFFRGVVELNTQPQGVATHSNRKNVCFG